MLANIPDNTPLYLLAPKCTFSGAPEPQRLEKILFHHTDDGPRFSVTSDKLDRPYRHYIHLKHLVNYYAKYVSPVSGYAEANPLEFLFLAEGHHKDRSLKDMEADRLEFYEEEAALPIVAPPLALPPTPEVEAFRARLAEIEKKVDTVLACQEMLRRLEAMKLNLKW